MGKKQKIMFVENNVKDNVEYDSDIESTLDIDNINGSTANILKINGNGNHENDENDIDELPRTLIPQKFNDINNNNDKFRKKEESKTPDIDTENIPNINDLEMESEILNETTLGKDTQLRLQKARYKKLEKDFKNLVEIGNEKEKKKKKKNFEKLKKKKKKKKKKS